MNIQKRLFYSVTIAVMFFFISIFVPFIPCQTAPGPQIPNPTYQWTFCNLNPDSLNIQGITHKYLGYTTSLTEAYLLTLIISFALAMIVLHFIARKKKDN